MPRAKRVLVSDLSIAELRRLLEIKEKTAALEAKRMKLLAELTRVESSLEKAAKGITGQRRGRRAKASTEGRKVSSRKAAKGRGAAAAAQAAAGGAGRRGQQRQGLAVKQARRPGAAAGPPTIQGVVADLIRKHGGPLTFQEILGTIQRRKLVKTKSKDFANVLRRTLSTSKTIKHVGRGTYGV